MKETLKPIAYTLAGIIMVTFIIFYAIGYAIYDIFRRKE